jgi:hypothetical protein
MTFTNAALSATYPVVIFLGIIIMLRFLPVLTQVDPPVRALICSQLTLVGGIVWEQALYGYARMADKYIPIALTAALVSIGKVIFILGMVYMLYAFWMIATPKPRLIIPLAMAAVVWLMITGALML